MEIEHFSHQHPLILREDCPLILREDCKDDDDEDHEDDEDCEDDNDQDREDNDDQDRVDDDDDEEDCEDDDDQDREDDGEGVRCAGCGLAISGGPNYSCIKCNYFLHKSCAELPRNKAHPMHQKHPLTLLPCPPRSNKYKCDACHGFFKTFAYNCSTCKFTIDLRFASLPLTIKYESHEHSFTLLPKSAIFWCDACGTNCEGISYLCTTCFLWVHPKCAALPLSVKNIHHLHPLYLTRYLPTNSFRDIRCKICWIKVNVDNWFYYCESCNIFAHVECTASETKPIRDVTSSVKENEHLTENISSEDESVEIELEHYTHQHLLNLCDVVPKDEKCNGCTQPILDPYYNCHQCKFSLHVSCAKLPKYLKHPLHPKHRLALLPMSPNLHGIFRCEACTNLCNGFTYSCGVCNFNLDVACSSIAETLKHDSHKHLLVLGQKTSCEQCSACGEDCVGFAYGCGDCDFKLDTNCATLPSKAKHRFHRHTLNLTFSSIEDDSNEYYCDACEETRNPNYWVYYCAECNLSACLGCIRGEYPYIKFGGTREHVFHPHLLTLVQKTKDNPSTCNTCRCPCESLSYECTECKFNSHWMCQNSPKGMLNEDGEPDLSAMYSLDKTVYMMTTHDAREICQKERRSTKLKHVTHDDHFLTLGYVRNKIKIETCIACKIHLEGPCYQCQKCNIYLHKKCAEAPPVLHHRDHPQHPLKLNLFKWPQNQFNCSVCEKTGDSYGYQCKDCNFNLHMHCVSTTTEVPTTSEIHTLTRAKRCIRDLCLMDQQSSTGQIT